MSWQERNYPDDENPLRGYGRPGGDWQGLRPSFDNPLSWSLSLGRFAGIDVRVHIIFLIYIVIMLLRAGFGGIGESDGATVGFVIMLATLAILFVIVLVHEFGHCIGCRWTGGEANEILMWPLGGLAYCRPPNHWMAHMITVVAGPMVNLIICIFAGTMLGLLTGKWLGIAVPNPINPFGAFYDPTMTTWAHQGLYLINAISFLLLLFNLLPMFPLDGGRIVQAWLWRSMGYQRSMRIAVRIGFIGAILLGIFGFVIIGMTPYGGLMLVMIAIFGGMTCYHAQATRLHRGNDGLSRAMTMRSRWRTARRMRNLLTPLAGRNETPEEGSARKRKTERSIAFSTRLRRTAWTV
jgi:Zn-dependent protease